MGVFMPQDAFTLLHTAIELNKKLKNARIDKINQPDNDTIILQIRTNNQNQKLLLSANAESARVCTTLQDRPNPLTAPNFCMLLRKHLSHATIENVTTLNLERIIKIDFLCKNELKENQNKTLYCEIMGKYSNVILVENGIVLGALKQSTLDVSNLRPIFSGLKYTLPILQEKVSIFDEQVSMEKLKSMPCSGVANYIFNNFLGISKQTAMQVVFGFMEQNTLKFENEIISKITEFYSYFKTFYVSPNLRPNTVTTDNYSDFFICNYTYLDCEKKFYPSIDKTVDAYFSFKEQNKSFLSKKNKLVSAITAYQKKLQKKLQIIFEKELSCQNIEDIRLKGELLMSSLYLFKENTDKVDVMDYTKPDCPTITIHLDKTLSPKQNADKFFKRYAKLKKTLQAIAPQKQEVLQLLEYVSTLFTEIEQVEHIADFTEIEEELAINSIIKKQNSKKQQKILSKPRVYHYLGFEILVGKNNIQNDRLTLDADRTDVFVHTKDYHSAHVIIKAQNQEVPDKVIEFACEVCAFYSKAKNSTKVPVDYTLKKFVKKTSGLKTGMVIYTNQKTLLVTPNSHIE